MLRNIKKALKAVIADYMTAMEMYGEALNVYYNIKKRVSSITYTLFLLLCGINLITN